MKDRIRMIMESEGYTPARFADTLDIGRAIVSHILNGRNNPSLDVISRILEAFPSINPDWLLFGTGEMYRGSVGLNDSKHETDGIEQISSSFDSDKKNFDLFSQPEDLFTAKAQSSILSQNTIKEETNLSSPLSNAPIPEKGEVSISANLEKTDPISEKIVYKTLPAKKISQIIIYYDDNTFEVFNQ